MWRKILAAALFGLLANVADAGESARRLALVIGNIHYTQQPLANAARDAEDMSAALRERGYAVTSYTDLDTVAMRTALRTFSERLTKQDTALVYFAGHGVQVGETTLLLPADLRDAPAAPLAQGFDVRRIFDEAAPASSIVILDSCLDNPYSPANVRMIAPPARTVIAYASAPGGIAFDGKVHGRYTGALLDAMQRPGTSIEEALQEAATAVSASTGGRQAPWLTSARVAHATPVLPVVLASTIPGVPGRGILPKDSNEQYELTFWESIKDSTYASDYEAYLKAYPNGRFATLAHARIDRLRAATPKPEAPPARTPAPAAAAPAAAPAAKAAPAPAPSSTPTSASSSAPAATKSPVPTGAEIKDCPSCPALVALPGGVFSMGSNSDDPAERPVHRVTIAAPFAIGKYEVTVEQWSACVAASACARIDNTGNVGKSAPMRNLSWDDAQAYVKWLSKTTGKPYRLPSEAEWEYAARGGTTGAYWWGNEMRRGYADCKDCGEPWHKDSPVDVGSFAANPFGLFDMNGSVWEWVADCWHGSYKGAPSDGRPWDEAGCPVRVIRGGSWPDGAAYMQSSTRFKYSASVRQEQNGLRVVREMK